MRELTAILGLAIVILVVASYAYYNTTTQVDNLEEQNIVLKQKLQGKESMLEERANLLESKEERIEELKKALAIYNNIAVDSKLKTPKPRWSISIVEYPGEVESGESYSVTYQVENLLPIKDSIQVADYFFHKESWKYGDNYTTPVIPHNRTVVLPGGGKALVKGEFTVPGGYIPGEYILTGAVSYYDLEPIEYIDRRQVTLKEG